MGSIIGIIVVGIFIAAYEVPSLLRKKCKKEILVFCILLAFGMILSILNSLRIDIPNPFDFLTMIYKPFTDFVFNILK